MATQICQREMRNPRGLQRYCGEVVQSCNLLIEELVGKAKPTVHYQGGSMKLEIASIFLLL